MSIEISLVGLINSPDFYFCKDLVEQLSTLKSDSINAIYCQPMLEFEWISYLEFQKRLWKEDSWSFNQPCVILLDDNFLGGKDKLLEWSEKEFDFTFNSTDASSYKSIASEKYNQYFDHNDKSFIFMEFTYNESTCLGKLVCELYPKLCPKAVYNFVSLCTGEKGKLNSDVNLAYDGSVIHRIVPSGWIQGGDIIDGSGSNSVSIYNGQLFEDECFAISHDQRGILGLANHGPHTNGSQFYITFQPAPWMDKFYVAFGKVIEGSATLDKLENIDTYNQRPKKEVKVVNCGIHTV